MDEHDPYYRQPQETWGEFLKALGRGALFAIGVGLVLYGLTGGFL